MDMNEIFNELENMREMVLFNLGSVDYKVNAIIMSGNRNVGYIERVFDEILDYMGLCYYEVKPVFLKLLEYIYTFDEELTDDYINIFNSMFDEKIRKL